MSIKVRLVAAFVMLIGMLWPGMSLAASAQDLLVASFGTNSVKRYDGETGVYLGDFVAPGSGGLNGTHDLVFGPDNNLYVSGGFSPYGVFRYNGQTGDFIDVFASGGSLNNATGIVFRPDGYLYVVSADSNQVLRYHADTGAFVGAFTNFAFGDQPINIDFLQNGNMLVGLGYFDISNRIALVDGQTGAHLGDFVPRGSAGLSSPNGLLLKDDYLYVASHHSDEVKRYDALTGTFVDNFIPAGAGGLDGPTEFVFGPDGNLYVSSVNTNSVKEYNGVTGEYIRDFAVGGGLSGPMALIFLPAAVPEPGSLILLGSLMSSVLLFRRRRPS
jgi:WD40 repeat protein